MHYAPPALLAATLAASLVPAQAQAPTSPAATAAQAARRMAAGPVLVAQATAQPVPPASAVEPLPLPTRAAMGAAAPEPQLVAQAAAPAPRAATAPAPARRSAAAAGHGGGAGATPPCSGVTVDPPTTLTLGKSQVLRLPFPVARLIVGGRPGSRAGRPVQLTPPPGQPGTPPVAPPPAAGEGYDGVAEADVTLLSPTELFFLGRHAGSMNVVLQGNDGRCIVKDVVVTVDPSTLQAKLAELLPEENDVKVRGADNAIVLTGSVSDLARLDQVLSVAGSYGEGRKVVNLLRLTAPQQVMLEVTIAEVSKTLLDRFGLDFTRIVTSANGVRTSVISGILGGVPGVLGHFEPNTVGGTIAGSAAGSASSDAAAAAASVTTGSRGATVLGANMQKRDGVIRVLAEPNIMAISGQPASFLSGGRIFIPVAQANAGGIGSTITLAEKEFGVGLKFTPTVLDGRINLKVFSEVSELSQTGSPFTTVGGVTAVLPSLSTRKVDTTVQLADGQSFVVAGLIRNNMTEALNKFPGLGETPVLGALFRSTEFQNNQTELMFVVTPRLVKPVIGNLTLPTDNHVVPTRADVILRGMGEGQEPAPPPVQPQPALPAPASTTPGAAPSTSRP